jgi:hypothetical protein
VPSPVGIADWKAYTSRFGSDTLTVVHLATQACENERSIPLGQICPSDLVKLVSTNLLSRLWSYKKELLDGEGSRPQSLTPFDLEYSVMIFDEIHLAESMGQLQNACHQSAKHADFKIGQSATPLINSPLDLCFVANASNLPQGSDVPTSTSQLPRLKMPSQSHAPFRTFSSKLAYIQEDSDVSTESRRVTSYLYSTMQSRRMILGEAIDTLYSCQAHSTNDRPWQLLAR